MINKKFLRSSLINSKDILITQMGRFGSNKILMTISDSFAMLIPVLIAGSFAVIFRIFVFANQGGVSTSILGWIGMLHTLFLNGSITEITAIANATEALGPVINVEGLITFNPTFQITNGIALYSLISQEGANIFVALQVAVFDHIALFVLMAVSYNVARHSNTSSPILAILVGTTSFLIISGGSNSFLFWSGLTLPFDAGRLLPAMLAGFVFVSIYEWLSKNPKMKIKMAAGVPPAVSTSFAKLFPAVITLLIAVAMNALFTGSAYFAGFGSGSFSLAQGIAEAVQAPFFGIISSGDAQLALGIFYVSMVAMLWFFGLHGSNVIGGVFSPILIAGTLQNEAALSGIGEITVISAGTFDAFVFFGGAGATLALLIATMIFSKRQSAREITVFGGPPAIFNINEPIIFGYPIVLNFTLLIPFVSNQIILFVITYLAIIEFELVPPTSVIIPWTSPVGIGAFLATQSWEAIILAFFNFAIAIAIYSPFVLLANRQAKLKGEELVNPYAKYKKLSINV